MSHPSSNTTRYIVLPQVNIFYSFKCIFIITAFILVMSGIIYACIFDAKYTPNIMMFYDMIFDNYETSEKELTQFIRDIIGTIPAKNPLNSVPSTISSTRDIAGFGTMQDYSTTITTNTINDKLLKVKDNIATACNVIIMGIKSVFNKMAVRAYISGNTIRAVGAA
jgi:hypothetical protein